MPAGPQARRPPAPQESSRRARPSRSQSPSSSPWRSEASKPPAATSTLAPHHHRRQQSRVALLGVAWHRAAATSLPSGARRRRRSPPGRRSRSRRVPAPRACPGSHSSSASQHAYPTRVSSAAMPSLRAAPGPPLSPRAIQRTRALGGQRRGAAVVDDDHRGRLLRQHRGQRPLQVRRRRASRTRPTHPFTALSPRRRRNSSSPTSDLPSTHASTAVKVAQRPRHQIQPLVLLDPGPPRRRDTAGREVQVDLLVGEAGRAPEVGGRCSQCSVPPCRSPPRAPACRSPVETRPPRRACRPVALEQIRHADRLPWLADEEDHVPVVGDHADRSRVSH